MKNSPFIVRKGTSQDVPAAMQLIRELAEYEKAPHEVTATEESMKEDGFGKNPIFEMWVAECNEKIVGLALTYLRYSTWKCGSGLSCLAGILLHLNERKSTRRLIHKIGK